MNTVHRIASAVIPTNSDGLLIPRLIPVAALLCVEGYADAARERILARLADGVSARDCARDGLLEWADLPEVERLTARSSQLPVASCQQEPVADGVDAARWEAMCAAHDAEMAALDRDQVEPFDLDFPRAMSPTEYRAALRELVAELAAD